MRYQPDQKMVDGAIESSFGHYGIESMGGQHLLKELIKGFPHYVTKIRLTFQFSDQTLTLIGKPWTLDITFSESSIHREKVWNETSCIWLRNFKYPKRPHVRKDGNPVIELIQLKGWQQDSELIKVVQLADKAFRNQIEHAIQQHCELLKPLMNYMGTLKILQESIPTPPPPPPTNLNSSTSEEMEEKTMDSSTKKQKRKESVIMSSSVQDETWG